jgi:hypothetical protein
MASTDKGWEVRLLDRNGMPVVGAMVSLAAAPVSVTDLGLVTDDDGRVVLRPAMPGRWTLRVWYQGQLHELTVTLPTSTTVAELRLPC